MSDNTSPTGDSENPYAPPVAAVRTSVGDSVQFAPGFFEIVDGVVICSGDFSISPLCIETGEPVRSGDKKDYKTTLFAPKQNRTTLFRFLFFLHQSIFVTGFVLGYLLDSKMLRISDVPLGGFFFAYLAFMIFVLSRLPSISLIFRRSRAGVRIGNRRKRLPVIVLFATLLCGLFTLKTAFHIHVLLGLAGTALAIIIPTVTLHYVPSPYATRDAAGRFHIHGLQPPLIEALQRYAQQVGS